MPENIELDPVDFITVGTIGEKGNRTFHLQAKKDDQLVTFTFEKEQASALASGIDEIMKEVEDQFQRETPDVDFNSEDMELQEPIIPTFRVAEMRLGYDNATDLVQISLSELLPEEQLDDQRMARLSGTREQIKQLAEHTRHVVSKGRAKPEQNGYRMHY